MDRTFHLARAKWADTRWDSEDSRFREKNGNNLPQRENGSNRVLDARRATWRNRFPARERRPPLCEIHLTVISWLTRATHRSAGSSAARNNRSPYRQLVNLSGPFAIVPKPYPSLIRRESRASITYIVWPFARIHLAKTHFTVIYYNLPELVLLFEISN